MTDTTSRKLRALNELPQDIAPTRDLWPGIAAAIANDTAAAGESALQLPVRRQAQRRLPRLALGLAASVALLAVGVWLGRNMLPGQADGSTMLAQTTPTPAAGATPAPLTMAASFELDPASRTERQRRLGALAGQLAALPPETQAKVKASIAAIEKGVLDIQTALGRDPGNLLLQEMLVNSYQEEMRVLGAVDEANRTTMGPGI
jgi:hypothetical protein